VGIQNEAFLRELKCDDASSRTDLEAEVSDRLIRKKNYMASTRIATAMMSEDVVSTELMKRSMSSLYPEGDAA
jgi:hypothetical protein